MTAPRSIHVLRMPTVLCGVLLLAACSILPKQETLHVWRPPTTTPAATAAKQSFSLRVDTPHASGPLDATTIMVLPSPGQVSTYKGARWSDTPALLVRQRLVDGFMAAGLPAITTDDDTVLSDYTLSGELRAFQTEYRSGSPLVVVRYDARLRRSGSRHLLAARSFTVTESPADADIPEVVNAFGAAEDALARQVVAWTLATADKQGG